MSALNHWKERNLPSRTAIFGDLDSSWDRFDRMFEEFSRIMTPLRAEISNGYNPNCNVLETEDGYLFKIDLPGLKAKEINIEILNSQLIVSGERKEDQESKIGSYSWSEQRYGSFRRAFSLPEGTKEKDIEASYVNGVLSVAVKKPESFKPKKIEIKHKVGEITEKVLTKLGISEKSETQKHNVANS